MGIGNPDEELRHRQDLRLDQEMTAAQFSARHPHSVAAVETELDRYDPRLGVQPTPLSSIGAP